MSCTKIKLIPAKQYTLEELRYQYDWYFKRYKELYLKKQKTKSK